jgi:opacity protein-like surface antigen
MRRRIVFLTLALILVASQAAAQSSTFRRGDSRYSRWEFSLQTRYMAGQSFDGDGGSSLNLEDDLGWGFGFGFNRSENLYLGMYFTWRSAPYSAAVVDYDDPNVSESYSGRLDTSGFGFEGQWNISAGKFTPYLSGGLGWTLIDSNIYAGLESGCWWDPFWGYWCDTYATTYAVNVFGANLGLGGRFDVSDGIFIRAGYEHSFIDDPTIDGADLFRFDIGILN